MPSTDKRPSLPIYTIVPEAHGFVLCRDAAPMKTPAGSSFVLPTRVLAEKIAEEWRAQGVRVKPETMALTQLAATALDVLSKKKDEVVANLTAYAASDLLCHRAEAPPELAERQAKIWQPWLDWAEENYKVFLRVGQGVMPIVEPESSLSALRDVVAAYDLFHLVGLQQAVSVTGSLILGLALTEKKAATEDLFQAAELDALFQMEQWGEDPITIERHASVKRELELCLRWISLLEQ